MKILLFCNLSQNIYNFRVPLINALKDKGYEVETMSLDDAYQDMLAKEGIKNYSMDVKYRSINPFSILAMKKRIKRTIKDSHPDVVFTFMPKPNIYGVQTAHKLKIKNIFSMVEGAGDAFINKSIKWKIIKKVECILYKKAFKHASKVFFLNNDDKAEFEMLKLVKRGQGIVVNGIGVDLEKFAFEPINKSSNKFIMIARMLETKGIYEYCKCAELVKKTHPEAEFMYLGGEGSVKVADIQKYIDNESINYLGTTTDVRPYIKKSLLLLLLSSYREGLPMTIMEAESMGRGIITSNNIGCKETVQDGYNGFIVEQKDYETMAKKCIEVLENKNLAERFGKNARKFAEDKFDHKKINQQIFDVVGE